MQNNPNINWFPGHMAKAKREIAKSLSLVDVVIELLDARIPDSSKNPDFVELFSTKPIITLLTKTSLADDKKTAQWVETLSTKDNIVIPVDSKSKMNFQKIQPAVNLLLEDKLEANRIKGIKKIPRAMVVGITNVGKSTFINSFTGTKKAKVEDRPGVTRRNQWIPAGDRIEFLDTPGLLWPKISDPYAGVKLALTGAIRDEILDTLGLSIKLLELLKKDYPDLVNNRYKVMPTEDMTALELFEAIARKRGFLIRGGEIDEDRCSSILLDEFREGLIGKITLD